MKTKILSVFLAVVMLLGVFPLSVFAANETIEFSFDKESYSVGDDVFLTIDAKNVGADAWIGVYCQNDPTDGSVKSIGWYNISDGNNTAVNITKDTAIMEWNNERSAYYYFPAKTYKVVAFVDGGYTAFDSAEFTINNPEGEASFEIGVNKTSFDAQEDIIITAKGENFSPDAWVGVYLQSDTYGANIGVESIIWYNLKDANGVGVNLRNLPSFVSMQSTRTAYHSFPAGNYIAYIFEDGGYYQATSVEFTVNGGSAPVLEPFVKTDKSVYKLGEAINVTAGNGSWVGIYAKGETPAPDLSRSWYYVYQANQIPIDIMGSETVQKQGTGKYANGDYVAYLFADDGYDNIIAEAEFSIEGTVEVDASNYSLTCDKELYSFGEAVNVTASVEGDPGSAWVGLYKAEDDPGVSTSFRWYYLKEHNNVSFNILNATPGRDEVMEPGEYKIIIFANSGYALSVDSLTKYISIYKDVDSEEILTPASCENSGLKKIIYKDSTSQIVVIPALGGTHESKDFDIVKEPTCLNEGIKEGVCDKCGCVFTAAIPAYGHLFKGTFSGNGDGTHSRFCVRKGCDAVETENCTFNDDVIYSGSFYRTCKDCDSTTIYAFSLKTSSDSVTVNYTSPDFAGGYELSLLDANGNVISTKTGNNSSEIFKGLTPATQYQITAKLYSLNGSSKRYSNIARLSFVTNPLPSAMVSVAAGNLKVTAKYKNVKGVTGYQVEYSPNADFSSSKKATIKGAVNVSKTITSLKYNTKYYFRVRTYKSIGGKNYFSTWSGKISCTVKPVVGAVKIKSLAAVKSGFTLKRTSVSNISGYQIQYSANAKFSNAKLLTIRNAKLLTKTVNKLKAKTTYYVRVRGFKTVSKTNYFSAWTVASKVKTK